MNLRLLLILLPLSCIVSISAVAESKVKLPIHYYKLQNGLKVVISEDHFSPVVAVGMYYRAGSRSDPEGASGFAHLFEHLMFQGTVNVSKKEFARHIEGNGGSFQGFTKMDFTSYYEMLPANRVETALWLEADRMQYLNVTEENLRNQKDVVLEEIRSNVLNAPYAQFDWYDLWQAAHQNRHNAHSSGMNDVENATVQMAVAFYQTYYSPGNAALIVTGDVEVPTIKEMVEKYFSKIPGRQQPPKPNVDEPEQKEEKRLQQKDEFARLPAIAIGYHMPPRDSPDFAPLVLLNIILQGDPGSEPYHPRQDPGSRLYRRLVNEKQLCLEWSGAIHLNPWNTGNEFDYFGPMLLTMRGIYKEGVRAEDLVANIDEVIEQIKTHGVTQRELDGAKTQFKSDYYDQLESHTARANLLASFALFYDDPERIHSALDPFLRVRVSEIKSAATKYFKRENRTIIDRVPAGVE